MFLLGYFAYLPAYGYDWLMDELLVPLFVDKTYVELHHQVFQHLLEG